MGPPTCLRRIRPSLANMGIVKTSLRRSRCWIPQPPLLETWHAPTNGTTWQPRQCLLQTKPSWVAQERSGQDGAFWAPGFAVDRTTGELLMHYSVYQSRFEGDKEIESACLGMLRARGGALLSPFGQLRPGLT